MTLVAAVFASAVLAEAGMTGTTEVTLRPTKDSTVSEADPGMNFGSNSSLLVGEFQGDEWITYTDWDFGEIPAGVTIEEVEMRFVRGCTGFTDPIAIQLRNIDSGWSESGVRWNNRPGLSSIAGVSAILLPNCTGATDLIVFESPNSDPLIDWVQGIVDGGTSNGMAFIAPSGSPLAAIESSEGDDGVSLFVTYSKDAAPPEITLVEQLDEIDSDA
ncbi:MAG: DNRLRE domain-containing protein, partial [Planctomycetota bacterium]